MPVSARPENPAPTTETGFQSRVRNSLVTVPRRFHGGSTAVPRQARPTPLKQLIQTTRMTFLDSSRRALQHIKRCFFFFARDFFVKTGSMDHITLVPRPVPQPESLVPQPGSFVPPPAEGWFHSWFRFHSWFHSSEPVPRPDQPVPRIPELINFPVTSHGGG